MSLTRPFVFLSLIACTLLTSSCRRGDFWCSCTFTEGSFFFQFENEEGEFYRRTRESAAESDCDKFSNDIKEDHPDAICTLQEV